MAENEAQEYRFCTLEREIKEIKKEIKPIVELQFGFKELTASMEKLSTQFEEFSKLNNSRTYEWLKYLITLGIGAAVTFFIK